MAGPSESFFEEISRRGSDELLEGANGVIRFDIDDNGHSERWVVSIDDGALDVSHRNVTADTRVRLTRKTFEQVVAGKANVTAGVLQGAIVAQGDLELLIRFQRLFPGPPGGAARRTGSRKGSR
jgi:hypothetical protein